MTDDRSLERAARSWLETGPTQAPDRAVEAALLRIETTRQERDLRIPWRLPKMFTPARLAAAALLGALVLGGTLLLLGGGGRPSVVNPSPSPTPAVSPAASPTASRANVRTPAPNTTWGDWETEAAAEIVPYASAGERIQWSIDWQDGLGTWLQTSSGDQAMHADSVTAQPGEIHLVSTEGQAGGCSIGDEGRYTWSRSADGLFLTLTKVEDACPARAAILARTWVHPLDAVNDGGPGVSPFANRWVQVTLPSMRFAASGPNEAPDIHLFDAQAPSIRLVVIKDPRGFAKPCSTSDHTTASIPQTTAGFVAYVRSLPGLTVKTTNATVGGRPAVHVQVSPKGAPPCGVMGAFHSLDMSPVAPEGEWDITPANLHSFWIVDVDADTYLCWYEGGGVTPPDEQAVISSVKFLDKLPVP